MVDVMLIAELKKSLGVLVDDNSLDDYYRQQLKIAETDLMSEDISQEVLDSCIGRTTQVLYAKALIESKDIATDNTINFLRNKLCSISRGKRVGG